MNGRLENDLKNKAKIKKLLNMMPPCLTDFYNYMTASGELPKSSLEYLRVLKRFFEYLTDDVQNIRIASITQKEVSGFIVSRQTTVKNGQVKKTTNSYQRHIYNALKKFFDFMCESDAIEKNPMGLIKRPKGEDNVKRFHLTAEDMNDILHAVVSGAGSPKAKTRQKKWQARDRAILMTFMCTGIRETALSEINIENVDLENRIITVIDKRETTHAYAINNKLENALRVWLNYRRNELQLLDEGALFVSDYNNRISIDALQRIVKKYSKEALGYELSPHKIRAAFATILYEQTSDLEFVRRAVGHKNIETTKIYAVESGREKERASSILEGLIE